MRKYVNWLPLVIVILTFLVVVKLNPSAKTPTKVSSQELALQEQVINAFNLKDNELKPVPLNNIFQNKTIQAGDEAKTKIVMAIRILSESQELGIGDLKPVIFLEGTHTVLIGVKHPNQTITLTKFDITEEKPVMINCEIKGL